MKKHLFILLVFITLYSSCNTNPKLKQEIFAPSLDSPNVQIGVVDIQFNRPFPVPGLRKIPVRVFYFPIEDAVCLQWRMDAENRYMFWSTEGRDDFINSLVKYKVDFDTRAFDRNSNRSRVKYGTTTGYFIWQMLNITIQKRSSSTIDFGYWFVERSPYFMVTQRKLEFYDRNRNENNEHPTLSLYFTRSQADQLAKLFDPETLSAIQINIPSTIRQGSIFSDFDDYNSIENEIELDNQY